MITFSSADEQNQTVLREMAGEAVYTECTEDFILPDYLPQIRKLLRVDARAVPSGHFAGADKVEFAGQVLYTVCYTDAEGRLTAVPLHTDYEYSIAAKEGTPSVVCCHEVAEGIQCRPAGPRKVTLRCRIRALPHAYAALPAQEKAEQLSGLAAEHLEKLTKKVSSMHTASAFSGEQLAETVIPLDGMQADNVRVHFVNGGVLPDQTHAEDGSVHCRGTLFLRVLAEDGDGIPFVQTRKIEFSLIMPCDACHPGMACTAKGMLLSADATVNQTPLGAELVVRASYAVEAGVYENQTLALVQDVYSPKAQLSCRTRQNLLLSFVGCADGNFTVSGEGKAEAPCVTSVLDTQISVQSAALTRKGRRVLLEGDMRACMLVCAEEDGSAYTAAEEMLFPFRYEAEIGEDCKESDRVEWTFSPLYAMGKCENGMLSVTGEVACTVCVTRSDMHDIPDKIDVMQEETAQDDNVIRIYYPQQGDTLWQVAKKYRVSLSDLLAANRLPPMEQQDTDTAKSLDGMMWLSIS